MRTIRIVVSDPDVYAYLEDCTSRIPGMQVLTDSERRPDLLVTDVFDSSHRDDPDSGVPRLYVLDEPPLVGKSEPIEFILTPFDARAVAHAVHRALRQTRNPP
jgi:hypothetical protein